MVVTKDKSIKTKCFCKKKKIIQNILSYNSRPKGETNFNIKK